MKEKNYNYEEFIQEGKDLMEIHKRKKSFLCSILRSIVGLIISGVAGVINFHVFKIDSEILYIFISLLATVFMCIILNPYMKQKIREIVFCFASFFMEYFGQLAIIMLI